MRSFISGCWRSAWLSSTAQRIGDSGSPKNTSAIPSPVGKQMSMSFRRARAKAAVLRTASCSLAKRSQRRASHGNLFRDRWRQVWLALNHRESQHLEPEMSCKGYVLYRKIRQKHPRSKSKGTQVRAWQCWLAITRPVNEHTAAHQKSQSP